MSSDAAFIILSLFLLIESVPEGQERKHQRTEHKSKEDLMQVTQEVYLCTSLWIRLYTLQEFADDVRIQSFNI